MQLQPGQPAPDFTLYNTKKEAVTLSSFLGTKVVLLFYPAAFTGTCTKELCSVRNDIASYNAINAVVFGISTDTVFSLIRYKDEQALNFELLADYNKEVCASYGAQYDTFIMGMKGTARRAAFVIDEKGNIAYAEVLESAGDLPDFNKIKAALNS